VLDSVYYGNNVYNLNYQVSIRKWKIRRTFKTV